MAECPNCGMHPLGNAWVVMLQLRSGTDVEGRLCQTCGTVFVEDPKDSVHQEIIDDHLEGENQCE